MTLVVRPNRPPARRPRLPLVRRARHARPPAWRRVLAEHRPHPSVVGRILLVLGVAALVASVVWMVAHGVTAAAVVVAAQGVVHLVAGAVIT